MYNCLPMYHSVGGVVATGAVLVGGGSVVVREGFSASRFWDDIARWDCTLFQYIGELCRYLLHTAPVAERSRPPHPAVLRQRAAAGRVGGVPGALPHPAASSSSTPPRRATCPCSTSRAGPGAIGRIPPFLAHRFPIALVRFDFEKGEPIRDENGLCIRCGANEPGEAIGRIAADPSRPGARSRATPASRPASARSCATCSRRATRGFAPAT